MGLRLVSSCPIDNVTPIRSFDWPKRKLHNFTFGRRPKFFFSRRSRFLFQLELTQLPQIKASQNAYVKQFFFEATTQSRKSIKPTFFQKKYQQHAKTVLFHTGISIKGWYFHPIFIFIIDIVKLDENKKVQRRSCRCTLGGFRFLSCFCAQTD